MKRAGPVPALLCFGKGKEAEPGMFWDIDLLAAPEVLGRSADRSVISVYFPF
ncbi:hypothetical protein [Kaistella sp.]|uniref:hypothetical protein n=1 Tax=Kaistella sp. TaxID=2782235 RepID=UPI002F926135